MSDIMPTFSDQRFRQVLGHYPSGVCVITAQAGDGTLSGMAVSSFTSVSLDPPLVAFFPAITSSSWAKMKEAEHFGVNILAQDQRSICRQFAVSGADKFAGVSYQMSSRGVPLLDGVVAQIECRVHDVIEAGDHYIVLGHVLDLSADSTRDPMLFFQSGYGGFATETPA